ncbi:MAG: hypothetical protein BroJett021_20250 [Chloroflexota bacterium]|nr:HEPN domain-containing protein [Caldilinea sp.]GIK73037.1 MAG: hypothetical protein BroJett021_20250 [Chloroflexota bacterium]
MSAVDSSLPQDWLNLADMDAQAATILLAEDGPLMIVAFHLQQAMEKSLKGYLLATGWQLRRLHDLELLINEATRRDVGFAEFLEPSQRITEYYIESRYPIGVQSPLDKEALLADLAIVKRLQYLIQSKLSAAAKT